MAKKDKQFRETTIENYYDLKVDKVDELVAALKGDIEQQDDNNLSMYITDCTGVYDKDGYTRSGKKKKFDPYKTDFLGRVPAWIKAFIVKFWFAGAVCFFVMWGINLSDQLDAIVLRGAVLGVITDLFVNPMFRYMESDRKEFDNFMMFPFPFKALWTFFANLLYYVAVMFLVNWCYFGLNSLCNLIAGTPDTFYVGVEPLLFGVFCVFADMVFIGIKDFMVYLVHRRKKGAEDD